MLNSKNNIALVTGASRGLGYQVAKLLGEKGLHVVGLARTVGGLETLSDDIKKANGSSTMVPINLESDVDLDELAVAISKRWKRIDIFIHCACIASPMSPVTSTSMKDFENLFKLNVKITLKLIQIIDPLLKLSTVKKAIFLDDRHAGKFLSLYAASKAASREIVAAYKEESKRIGPKVITFNPKPMPTGLRARFYPGEDKNELESCLSQAKELIEKAKL